MKATISTLGKPATFSLELLAEAKPSTSGKTRVIGTFSGPIGVNIQGKPVRATITAYTYPEPRPTLAKNQSGVTARIGRPANGKPAVLELEVPTFEPKLSSSEKSMLIASASGGTGFKLGEFEVMVNVNAFFKN